MTCIKRIESVIQLKLNLLIRMIQEYFILGLVSFFFDHIIFNEMKRQNKQSFRKTDPPHTSVLSSAQKGESNFTSLKSLHQSSPQNIDDKINFINQLYDQLQEKSLTETPEQQQPIQPTQIDETVMWTFNNSRNHSHDRTTINPNVFNNVNIHHPIDTTMIKRTLNQTKEKEQLINEMFEEIQGRNNKKTSKNYLQMNKQSDTIARKHHQTYEKSLKTIDKRIKQSTTPTKRSKQQSSFLAQPLVQPQVQSQPIPLKQPQCLDNDYKRFLDEISQLGERLKKTSGSLNRTMTRINQGEIRRPI